MEAVWVQVVVAAGSLVIAAVGLAVAGAVLRYTARKDARDARAEMQEAIDRSLKALRSDVGRLETKLDKVSDDVGRLGREVSILYGWRQGQDRAPQTGGFTSQDAALQGSEKPS